MAAVGKVDGHGLCRDGSVGTCGRQFCTEEDDSECIMGPFPPPQSIVNCIGYPFNSDFGNTKTSLDLQVIKPSKYPPPPALTALAWGGGQLAHFTTERALVVDTLTSGGQRPSTRR